MDYSRKIASAYQSARERMGVVVYRCRHRLRACVYRAPRRRRLRGQGLSRYPRGPRIREPVDLRRSPLVPRIARRSKAEDCELRMKESARRTHGHDQVLTQRPSLQSRIRVSRMVRVDRTNHWAMNNRCRLRINTHRVCDRRFSVEQHYYEGM